MVKKISILATILLLVGIIGVGFTIKSQFKPAQTLEKETVDAEEFTHIDLHAGNSKVILTPTNEDHATVELHGQNDDYTFAVAAEDNMLKVKLESKQKLFNIDVFPQKLSIHVDLPEKVYESIQVTSDNGKIEMNEIGTEALFVETYNGVIQAKDIDTDTANVYTHNGVITMEHVHGEVVGKTSNGVIKFITDHLDQSIELRTDNGKIDVQSDKKPTNAILDLQTGNGVIHYFGEKTWDNVIGDGDHTIRLTSGNGKITVK